MEDFCTVKAIWGLVKSTHKKKNNDAELERCIFTGWADRKNHMGESQRHTTPQAAAICT